MIVEIHGGYALVRGEKMLARISLLVMLGGAMTAMADSRPNILVLMAEDMSHRVGSFGDAVALTPHIDQLAEEGIRYTNVYTTAGVCAPSRAAFVTGMHQIAIGAQHMRTATRPAGAYKAVPPPHVKAFPEYLREVGYYTFTDRKLDYQFSGAFAGSGPFTIWDVEGEDAGWSGRAEGQPFFGLVNLLVTHESGIFPPLGNWPHSRTHLTMQVFRWLAEGFVEEVVDPGDVNLEPYYPDTPTVRADIARHYNNIHLMDKQVGDIIRRLKSEGLLENTIVIWTTDHGDGLPRAKRDLYDSGIHVPMILRWPDGLDAGSSDERLVSFIDFAPTILRLAGVEKRNHFHGRDFLVDKPREFIFASRDRIDAVDDRRRIVRNHRYKYFRNWYPEAETGHFLNFRDNVPMVREMFQMLEAGQLDDVQRQWFEPTGAEQLFDLVNDPHEINNLIGQEEFEAVRAELSSVLDEWLAVTGDTSETPEAEMVEQINPGGSVPVTASPVAISSDGRLHVSSATEGASLGYRVNNAPWRIYTDEFEVQYGDRVVTKAVRYGWQESEEVEFVVP